MDQDRRKERKGRKGNETASGAFGHEAPGPPGVTGTLRPTAGVICIHGPSPLPPAPSSFTGLRKLERFKDLTRYFASLLSAGNGISGATWLLNTQSLHPHLDTQGVLKYQEAFTKDLPGSGM